IFVLLGLAGNFAMKKDKVQGQALTVMATTSPLWQRAANPVMTAAEFDKVSRTLGMWQSPQEVVKGSAGQPSAQTTSGASGSAKNMNLVVIFQESTYNKYLSL